MSNSFWNDVIAVSMVYRDAVKGNNWVTLLVGQWIDIKRILNTFSFHVPNASPSQILPLQTLLHKNSKCHCQLLMSSSLHSYLSLRPPLHAYVGSSHLEWNCSIINKSSTSWMQVISTTICFLTKTILDPLTHLECVPINLQQKNDTRSANILQKFINVLGHI